MSMKYNYIFAILAIICGIIGTFIAFFMSVVSEDLIFNALMALISTIFGGISMWLYSKDPFKSCVLYVLCAFGVLIGIFIFGIPAFLLFLMAAIGAYMERDKVDIPISPTAEVHTFGEQSATQQFSRPPVDTNKYWIIHIILVIILICILGASMVYDSAPAENETVLNVTNISITSEGYSLYTVKCDIVPLENFSYLEMQVIFYDSSGAVIGKSPLAWNINNPVANETIKASGRATTDSSSTRPARAEIYIYDSVFSGNDTSEAVYHKTVNISSK